MIRSTGRLNQPHRITQVLPLNRLAKSLFNLIYPPLCLHCNESLPTESQLFCDACLEQLQLIDPAERCPHCFSAEYDAQEKRCPECHLRNPVLNGIAAAFDYAGPAASMVRSLKYGNMPYLAAGAGAYLAAQFLSLEWPMPDCIVPVPMPTNRELDRGFNQGMLLAKSLSEILNRPVVDALKRASGDYSQAGLSRAQRLEFAGTSITVKDGVNLADKCILFVDDVMTTGTTLRTCAGALQEQAPASIYAITVCRAFR